MGLAGGDLAGAWPPVAPSDIVESVGAVKLDGIHSPDGYSEARKRTASLIPDPPCYSV